MKTCRKCGAHFEGRYCKPCNQAAKAASMARNHEKYKAYGKAYRAANIAKAKEYYAAWYAANAGSVKARSAKWKADNPERRKAAVSKWSAANPKKRLASSAKYRTKNLEAYRIYQHNRRGRETGGKLSRDLAERLYILQRGKCACGCRKPLGNDFHRDHIMPLALGGLNIDSNIQLLRARCNIRKQAKHPVEFMQQRGFLL